MSFTHLCFKYLYISVIQTQIIYTVAHKILLLKSYCFSDERYK